MKPKAKFRVGQVVRYVNGAGQYFQIESWHYDPQGYIRYSMMNLTIRESSLRPLTKRERGDA